MSRNLLQDMVKVKNSSSRPIKRLEKEVEEERRIPDKIMRSGDKGSKYRLFFVAFVAIVFLLFALSYLFSGAKITINPKIKNIPLNDNLSAIKNGSSESSANISELSFDLVVISGEENKIIQGSGNDTVARGTVSIFNSFSSSPQTLAIDTRLEGSNGKIYKTDKQITVPGIKKDGTPGSIEVNIHASFPGKEYNSTPLDFQIFGFKGTPKYSKFKVRSIGDIVSGPVVSSLDKTTTVSELKNILETKLTQKVENQIPSGFILYKDAVFLDIKDKDVSFTSQGDNMVSVNVKGTLYGFILDEKKLTKKIAQDVIEKYDDSDVYIPNIRDLIFSLADKESIDFANVKKISFTLVSTPKIIWKIDEAKFINSILNRKKSEFNQILMQFPNIDSAELVIRPFWKSSFPEKSKSVQIIVNYPK
ncbi:MAG: hypothetical protein WCS86_03855 [Candidatus Paceibacterota bacterium]